MTPNTSPATDFGRLTSALRSKYWSWTYLDTASCPSRLFECLTVNLPHIDASSWPARFDWGGVYVNGIPALDDRELQAPCKVEYYEPKFDFAHPTGLFPEVTTNNIVFQDDDLIVVFKPYRLPTMPAKEQRHYSLKHSVEKLTGRVPHFPSRLDVSVCGLVPVSISARMHPLVQQLFESREVDKEYTLEASDRPAWSGVSAIGSIGRSSEHPVLRKVVESGGQTARTTFVVKNGRTILAKPITGRTHQIRVHIADLGYAIVGDNFYGGKEAGELHLCCSRLRFVHPVTGAALDVECPRSLLPEWARG